MANNTSQILHPTPEARQILGNIGHTLFYGEVAAGRLRLVHIGRRSFVTDVELQRYAKQLEDEAAAEQSGGERR